MTGAMTRRDDPGDAQTMIEIVSVSESETRAIARRLAARLRPGDVVALHGALGAGKTCFVRGLAAGLGVDPAEVSSPTFVLCHEYEGPLVRGRRVVLAHLDGYRLAGADELETIGWDELLASADTIIAVEWAERFGPALPEEHIAVTIGHDDATTRTITLSAPPALAARTIDRLDAETRTGRCPICGEPVDADGSAFPFCSGRCRLVDLGKWFGERYRLGGD